MALQYLRQVDLQQVVILISVLYVFFSLPVKVIAPALIISLWLITSNKPAYSDCQFTEAVCEFKKNGLACDKLKETFLEDEEWRNYRDAVCDELGNVLPTTSAKVRKSYSKSAFPDCPTKDITEIKRLINDFSRSKCKDQTDLEGLDGSTDLIEGTQLDTFFLFMGGIGVVLSLVILVIRSNKKFSLVPLATKDGPLGNER